MAEFNPIVFRLNPQDKLYDMSEKQIIIGEYISQRMAAMYLLKANNELGGTRDHERVIKLHGYISDFESYIINGSRLTDYLIG